MTRSRLLLVLTLLGGAPLRAQAPERLALDDFLARVRAHHPAVRQAGLALEAARGDRLAAAGAFDPAVGASWERKRYGGVAYYDYAAASLTVPTPFGADVKLGWERAAGKYASPDRRTPDGGLLTAGIALPLGQRLLTDERRAGLAAARAREASVDAERVALANKAVAQAAKDYADWYEATRRAEVTAEGLDLAAARLDFVRRRAAAGEAAPVDTIEAALEVAKREVLKEEAEQARTLARLRVEGHLWDAGGAPAPLAVEAAPAWSPPPPVDSAAVPLLAYRAERAHPEVRKAQGKSDAAEAERRLARQGLLPAAELQAFALGAAADPRLAPDAEDAKVGGLLKVPALLRKERGKLAAADAKADAQRVEVARARRDAGLAVRAAAADAGRLDRMLALQRTAVAQARLLRDAEQRRFEAGEGTLFLVTTRERAVLDEAAKLAALEAKRLAADAALRMAIGAM